MLRLDMLGRLEQKRNRNLFSEPPKPASVRAFILRAKACELKPFLREEGKDGGGLVGNKGYVSELMALKPALCRPNATVVFSSERNCMIILASQSDMSCASPSTQTSLQFSKTRLFLSHP